MNRRNNFYNFNFKRSQQGIVLTKVDTLIKSRPTLNIELEELGKELRKKLGEGSVAQTFTIKGNNDYILRSVISKKWIETETLGNRKNFELNKLCPNSVVRCIEYGRILSNNTIYSILEKGITDVNFFRVYLYKCRNNNEFIKFYLQILIISIEKIKCLHDNNYLHLDIKPENIMIFKGTAIDHDIEISNNLKSFIKKYLSLDLPTFIKVKYINFGCCKKVENVDNVVSNNPKGTREYISKNVSQGKYTYKADLYALGRMFTELILILNNKELHNNNKNKRFQGVKNSENNDIDKFLKLLKNNNTQNFKGLIQSLIPNSLGSEIKCLNGKNREESYSAMTDILYIIKYFFKI